MAIKTELTRSAFMDDLRSDEFANWTYSGASALYDYLQDLSDDTGQDIEFDRVAIRCDYTESTVEELADDYSNLKEEDETPLEFAERMEQERTTIIWVDQTHIIYRAF